jgi:3-isopropylmalate/(R)-2-methylmalate dehydratase small subunit
VVVSSFFADIFKNNALNSGVLPVVVSEAFLQEIFDTVYADAKSTLTVDLEKQVIRNNAKGREESFSINAYKKNCLLQGYDDIDFLLSNKDKIQAWENEND